MPLLSNLQSKPADHVFVAEKHLMSRLFNLQGNLVTITGGSRGIGFAIAWAMTEHRASVVLADVDEVRASSAAISLAAAGRAARFVAIDVSDSKAVDRLFNDPDSPAYGSHVVVNNAGITARIPAEAYPDGELDRIIDVNLKGVFYGMRSAARYWIAQGQSGRIINLASFAGLVAGSPLSGPLVRDQREPLVRQLTRTCAIEWGTRGILVNAIAPSYVRTDIGPAATLDSEAGRLVLAKTPLGRAPDPSEIAGAAVFLASPAASYVTGHILSVDGGWTAA